MVRGAILYEPPDFGISAAFASDLAPFLLSESSGGMAKVWSPGWQAQTRLRS